MGASSRTEVHVEHLAGLQLHTGGGAEPLRFGADQVFSGAEVEEGVLAMRLGLACAWRITVKYDPNIVGGAPVCRTGYGVFED